MKADWDELRIILALRRAGSFAAASHQLGINESTAIRRLAQAEERFAVRLFERKRGRLEATAAGAKVAEQAARIEAEYQAAIEAVSGTDLKAAGNVRLTAVPLLVNHLLAPAVPVLLRRHPEIRLELLAEPRSLSLDDRQADIALRLARPQGETRGLTRKIADIAYGIYGPADRDAAGLPWIGYEAGMRELPQARWIAALAGPEGGRVPSLFVNDAEALLAAIRAGQGKSFLPRLIGDRLPDLRRLDLYRTAKSQQEWRRELWLIVHRDLRQHPRIKAVVEWALEIFRDAAAAAAA